MVSFGNGGFYSALNPPPSRQGRKVGNLTNHL